MVGRGRTQMDFDKKSGAWKETRKRKRVHNIHSFVCANLANTELSGST